MSKKYFVAYTTFVENLKNNLQNYIEITVYYDDRFNNDFSIFIYALKAKLNDSVLLANVKNDDKNILSIAYNNENKFEVELIYKNFMYSLIKQYKLQFLKDNLQNLHLLGKLQDIFLKVLMYFDEETDRLEVERQMAFQDKIYLNEFYHFKLNKLRKKWLEICNLTNENCHFFESEHLTIELIKFLLNNIKIKHSAILIKKHNNTIEFENQNKQILLTLNQNFTNQDLIGGIIDNFSKIIIVDERVEINNELKKLLKTIFKNQIKFLS